MCDVRAAAIWDDLIQFYRPMGLEARTHQPLRVGHGGNGGANPTATGAVYVPGRNRTKNRQVRISIIREDGQGKKAPVSERHAVEADQNLGSERFARG